MTTPSRRKNDLPFHEKRMIAGQHSKLDILQEFAGMIDPEKEDGPELLAIFPYNSIDDCFHLIQLIDKVFSLPEKMELIDLIKQEIRRRTNSQYTTMYGLIFNFDPPLVADAIVKWILDFNNNPEFMEKEDDKEDNHGSSGDGEQSPDE